MRFLVALAALLIAAPASAQFSGTFTLGPSPGNDVETFQEIIEAFQQDGVNGPVVVEVEQATYTERVEIGNIPGASATNTVTFRGIPGTGGVLPVITNTPTAGEPYVAKLGKAHWVRLESLRFEVANENQSRGTILVIEADDVIVSNCEIKSIDDGSVSSDEAVGIDVGGFRVTIEDTEVDEGDIGIRFRDSPGGNPDGGQVLRNSLDRNVSAGIFIEDQSDATGTTISIRENNVVQNAPDVVGWVGIHVLDNTGGADVARNRTVPRSGTGIRVENITNASSSWTSVVNNMVAGSSFGIEATTGIEVVNADRVRVLNNTVNIFDDDGTGLLVDAASSGVRVVNNILVHEGTGYLMDVSSSALADHDYQVFQSPNEASKMLVRYDGGEYNDISDYQTDTGATNTIVWPVEFLSTSDLHLDGLSDGDGRLIGQPEPSAVPFDYDGDARNATRPYRGADEAATPLADPPPFMNGTYAINSGGSGDYTSFTAAIADLDLRGVDGPVTFIVQTNLFFESVTMGPVPGGSAANTVEFVGQIGTPQIRHDASGSFDNYVFRLYDVEYITFTRLAFRSEDATNADVVEVKGGANITFDQCVFIADTPDGRGILLDVSGVLNTTRGNAEAVRVLNSTFDGGYRAISIAAIISGADFVQTSGHEIIGNTITDLKTPTGSTVGLGISVSGKTSAVIQKNTIEASTSNDNFVGIRVGDGSTIDPLTDLLVEQNEVFIQNGIGIHWERFDTGTSPSGVDLRLANNTVRMTGNGPTVGLLIENSGDVVMAYNSISIASTNPASAAAVVDIIPQVTAADLDLRNNLFQANLGRALDLDVPGTSSKYVYNFNSLWSDGSVLARYKVGATDVNCTDLACIQAASGAGDQDNDTNVLEVTFEDPANGDLRLDPSMDGNTDLLAEVIAGVSIDIDDDSRSATDPYRGADERPTLLSFIVADPRIVLQGAYPGGATIDGFPDAMTTTLNTNDLLPLSNPYASSTFDGTLSEYDGTESVTQSFLDSNPTIVDWVVIGLRETSNGPDVAQRAVFLRSNTQLLDLDGSSGVTFSGRAAGDYFIVVYHRNHLPIMTAQTETVTSTASSSFVRMYRATELFGGASGAVLLEDASFDLYGMAAADGSLDGLVTAPDFNVYSSASASGATGYRIEDYTMDGLVTAPDFNLYNANAAAGAATAVPAN